MCGNPFKSPKTKTVTVEKPVIVEKPVEAKVEKMADPTPTPIAPTDTGAQETRMDTEREKQRKKKGYASTRTAEPVLTDTAQSGGRQTLG